MLNDKLLALGKRRSEIRELFEYGKTLVAQGLPVCDLTLGNPSTKTPDWVTQALKDALSIDNVHAYTQAQGTQKARQVIAKDLNKKHNVAFSEDGVILTWRHRFAEL